MIVLATLVATATGWADVVQTDRQRLAGLRDGKGEKAASPEAPGAVAFVDASGLEYFLNSDVTFSTSSSASGAANEATYTQAVVASTLNGGTTTSALNDAFDGYNAVCLAFDGSIGPCEVAGGGGEGFTPYTVYNDNGPGTIDTGCTSGGNLLLGTQSINGLNVRREVYVPSADELVRFATVLTNTTGATIDVNLITSNNLGSDGGTTVDQTSSGDAAAGIDDTWVTTFEAFSGLTSTDPRLAHVLQQDGFDTLGAVTFVNGDDNPVWHYPLRIDPGQTLTVLNYASGQPNLPDARDKAAELARTPVFDCLTADLATLHNFGAGPPPPNPLEIPLADTHGLALLAILLAGTALAVLRR
jgi:hypothetical protein